MTPEEIDSILSEATTAIEERRFGEAHDAVHSVLESHPDQPDALRLGADLALRRREPEAAIAMLSQASTGSATDRMALANIKIRAGDSAGALLEAKAAHEMDPSFPEACVMLADDALSRGEADEAIRLLDKANSAKPTHAASVRSTRAWALDALDQYEEAFHEASAAAAATTHAVPDNPGGSLEVVRALHRTAAFGPEHFRSWPPTTPDSIPRPRLVLMIAPTLAGSEAIARVIDAAPTASFCASHSPIRSLIDAASALAPDPHDVGALGSMDPSEIVRLRSVFYAALESASPDDALPIADRTIVLRLSLPSTPVALVRRVLPEATILGVVRDPRDVLLGCFFSRPRAFPSVYATVPDTAAVMYASYMSMARLRDWTGMGFVTVRYEDFAADPLGESNKLFAALGISAGHTPISAHTNTEPPRPHPAWDPDSPRTDVAGRWLSYAPFLKRAMLDLRPATQAFGYETGDDSPAPQDIARVATLARQAQALLQSAEPDQIRAEALLRQVLQLDPDHVSSLHILSRLLQVRGAPGESTAMIDRACDLDPSNPLLWTAAGENYVVKGDGEAAMERFARAVEIDPYRADAWAGLAGLYERSHRFDDAKACIESALSHTPDDPGCRLIKGRLARRAGDMQAARWTLEAVANDQNADETQRSTAWYELALIHDKAGQHASAFGAARNANRIVAGSAAFKRVDPQTIPRAVASLAQVNAEEYRSWKDEHDSLPDDGLRPVFLVGMPRSGTTMTGQILEAHPGITTVDERPVFGDAITPLMTSGQPLHEVMRTATPEQVKMVRERYDIAARREANLGANDPTVVVNKLPMLLAHVGIINRFFPDAVVFVAIRDPRDTLVSSFMQGFNVNSSMVHFLDQRAAANFQNTVLGGYLDTKDRFSLTTLDVRYEDTTEDLEATARKMIDTLGLDWDDRVLSFHENRSDRVVLTPSYEAITKPVNRNAVARWKGYTEQFATSFAMLAPLIQRLGYEPTAPQDAG